MHPNALNAPLGYFTAKDFKEFFASNGITRYRVIAFPGTVVFYLPSDQKEAIESVKDTRRPLS